MLSILLPLIIIAYFISGVLFLDTRKPVQETLNELTEILQKWHIKATLIKSIKWFSERGNQVTVGLIVAALILTWKAWNSSEDSIFYELRGEITGMAFSVVVIDIVVGYKNWLQEKKRILQQLSSRSNDFALDAARIIVEEGWHKDGSLKWLQLTRADLRNVELSGACLEGSVLHFALLTNALLNNANLQSTILVDAQLDGACLFFTNLSNAYLMRANLCGATLLGANLTNTELTGATLNHANLHGAYLDGANLHNAKYDFSTQWPDGFDPVAAGAILVDD